LVGLNSPPAIHEILTDIVHEALNHIAGDGFTSEVRQRLAELRKRETTQ
jgi:hypothetical protein